MAMLDDIRRKITRRQYEFSKHAVDQSIIRDIGVREIEEAILNRSELIEDYPDDKYGPSCLILGFTSADRPLHIQCIETEVTYTLELDGKFCLVEHVPARVCRETGEQYFSPETVEQIQALVKSKKKPDKIVETPVYEYGEW